MQGYRNDLEELWIADRELADQFRMLSSQLEHLAISLNSEVVAEGDFGSSVHFTARLQTHRQLSDQWDRVVERIRMIAGFTDFLQAVPFTTLQTTAAEGPVIIVNISKNHSDAIIITNGNHPVVVPLPEASLPDLISFSLQLSDDMLSSSDTCSILRKLWRIIVSPVRNALAALNIAEGTRVWWCPTSVLCTLPLHAAGPYLKRGLKNFSDLYISSYIPTLSALIKAR
jgi:hypothetical protein